MNVAPGRFSDKSEKEKKIYSIRWPIAVTGSEVSAPEWSSEPPGLAFVNSTLAGEIATVRIEQGARGTTYRVRHGVTVAATGEYLEVTSNGEPGIDLQITGHGRSGDDYRWSHRFHAYG